MCLENRADSGAGVTVAVVWLEIYNPHFVVAARVYVSHADVRVFDTEHVPYFRCLVSSLGALCFSMGVFPTCCGLCVWWPVCRATPYRKFLSSYGGR